MATSRLSVSFTLPDICNGGLKMYLLFTSELVTLFGQSGWNKCKFQKNNLTLEKFF